MSLYTKTRNKKNTQKLKIRKKGKLVYCDNIKMKQELHDLKELLSLTPPNIIPGFDGGDQYKKCKSNFNTSKSNF